MNILIFVFIFFFGTIIGSFLNVVIYRFNTGKPIVRGRSICMTCNKTLRWYELVPVLSWVLQKGKCRRCKEVISYQYPIVELITGIMFVLISYHFLPIAFFSLSQYILSVIIYVFIFSLLIVISVYDIKHKIIPDLLVYTFIIVSFVSLFINFSSPSSLFLLPSFSYIMAGPILASPFALLWLVSKGEWMGLGDAKIMLGLGFILGLPFGLASIVLSFWIGTVVSLLVLFFTKKKVTMKTEIPFAPFLVISAFVVFLFNIDILRLASIFNFIK